MAGVTLYCKHCSAPIVVQDVLATTPVICSNCDLQMQRDELLAEPRVARYGKLTVLTGLSTGEVFDLHSERISIGRDLDNRVRLDDKSVSHRHALLMWDQVEYKVRDLVSTNGTFVNGERVTETTRLKSGDALRVGTIQLRYDRQEGKPTPKKEPTRTPKARSYEDLVEKIAKPSEPVGEPSEEKKQGMAWVYWATIGLVAVLSACIIYAHHEQHWPFSERGPLAHWLRSPAELFELDADYKAAQAAEASKDYASLLASAQNLVTRYPKHAEAYYILGVALGELGFTDKAIQAFLQATNLEPGNGDAWNNLGWAYTRKGYHANAVAAFQQALKVIPNDPQTWSNLGGAYTAQEKWAEAVEAYQHAVTVDPNYANGWYNLGIAYASQKKYIDAIDAFRKAVKANPDFFEAWYNLGVVCHQGGENQEAVFFYREALKRRPEYVDAWGGLVRAYLAMKDYQKAGEAAREMKKLDPTKAADLAKELQQQAPE